MTAFAPDSTATDNIIALAVQYETASLASREAWRAYWAYADACPNGYEDAALAALYAAHITADDEASSRYTALLDALALHTRGDFASLVGSHAGRAVLVEWSRPLHLAYVHVNETRTGQAVS